MFENDPSDKRTKFTQPLVLSLVIHSVFISVLLTAHFTVKTVGRVRFASTKLVAPAAPPLVKRSAIRTPAARPTPLAKRPVFIAPAVTVRAPVIEAPPLPAATQIKLPAAAPVPLAAPPVLQPPALPGPQREVFAGVTSVAKPEPKAALQVQTGGFASASTAGGAAGQRQVVSAGFGGTEVAAPRTAAATVRMAGFGGGEVGSARKTSSGLVRTAGFGDAVSAAPPTGGARRPEPTVSAVAQILEKPRPAYTEEARRLRIEGEVQLEVVFGASGEIQILGVVHGLGHGLDENAVRAARSIRFLPARKDGQPVDSRATVHILFQLAS
jgi:TonB family protein